jgi:glycosyltransferase involved in cell wall biosynthesis
MARTVVYFTDTIGFGGAEQALLGLMSGLNRDEWRPMLMHHSAPGVALLLKGATRLGVELWPVPRMPEGREGAARLWSFARDLRRLRPDVFHAHLTWPLACKFGLAGAIMARVPAIVATVHLFVEFPLDLSICVQQRLIAAGVGRYLAVSHHVAQRLLKKLPWPVWKMQVIYNSVAATADGRSPIDPPRTRSIDQTDRPVVLTVARLDEQKGHRYLLEAAAQVPEAQFVLAGDGPLRASLEAQAQSLGLEGRVRFLGYRTDIPDLLASCDVFVLPSLYEGLPLSILEAMSAGKPVIATQIGGTDEAVIADETGLLVPPAAPAALAAAIRSVLVDRPWAQRLGQAGRARVEREFSAATMIQRVTKVYAELLSHRGAPNVQH